MAGLPPRLWPRSCKSPRGHTMALPRAHSWQSLCRTSLPILSRSAFLSKHVPAGAAGQVRSVAARFGLVGIAGELARDYGVLPWPEGEAWRVAGACFRSWLVERGGTGAAEDTAALAQVRLCIELHGESRFTQLVPGPGGSEPAPPELTRTINRVGWRRRPIGNANGSDRQTSQGWEFMILPGSWKGEVCKGLDSKRAADLLARHGLLVGGTERHRAALATIPGEGKLRVYIVSGAILEGGDAQ
jgi:putative DNA primase/helicase